MLQASFFSYARNREYDGSEVSEGYDCTVSVFISGTDQPHEGTLTERCAAAAFPRAHPTLREAVEEFLRAVQDRFPAVEKAAPEDHPLFAAEVAA